MIGNKFFAVAINVYSVGEFRGNHENTWQAFVKFQDFGHCDDESIQGVIGLKYENSLQLSIDTMINDCKNQYGLSRHKQGRVQGGRHADYQSPQAEREIENKNKSHGLGLIHAQMHKAVVQMILGGILQPLHYAAHLTAPNAGNRGIDHIEDRYGQNQQRSGKRNQRPAVGPATPYRYSREHESDQSGAAVAHEGDGAVPIIRKESQAGTGQGRGQHR